jgi:hypothetical protein
MKIKLLGCLALLATTLAFAAPNAQAADAEPYILPHTILVNAWRYGNYYPTPKAKEPQYNTWSWRPRYFFTVAGPLTGGSQISVSFYKPDGTLWLTQPCQTPEIAEGATGNIENPSDSGDAMLRQTITTTGVFTFKVTLKNELTSTNKTLYSGKFTVGKFHSGPNVPVNKNQFEYYVDHDWLLPIGYLFFDTRLNEEAPPMRLSIWFRGETKQEDVAAYVFYKGKQICSTKVSEEGSAYPKFAVSTTGSDPDPLWRNMLFSFHNVACYYKQVSANTKPMWHFLDANPGEYEIKVLRKGKLARSVTFTVGADGKVVDNGVAKKNKMGEFAIVVPVKILPGMDGKAKPETYKTDAFYGNPLAGFTAP